MFSSIKSCYYYSLILSFTELFPSIIEKIYYSFVSAHFPYVLGNSHVSETNRLKLNGIIRNLRYLFIPLNIRFTDIYLLSFHLRP